MTNDLTTRLPFEQAKEAGKLLSSDLQRLEDWTTETTFTFKVPKLRKFDYSEDRINKVLDCHQYVCRALGINRRQVSVIVKDEYQKHCGHCHVLTGGKVFKDNSILGSEVTKRIRQYWEGVNFWTPFENLTQQKKNHLMYNNDVPEWFSEEGYEFKKEPKIGWCRSRSLVRKKKEDLVRLISYSSKYVKGKQVVGLTHHCSSTLIKRMNNLYM